MYRRYGYRSTATGVGRLVILLSPSWPFRLLPQHISLPSTVFAHECEPPDVK